MKTLLTKATLYLILIYNSILRLGYYLEAREKRKRAEVIQTD